MQIINILAIGLLPAALVYAAPGVDPELSIRDASCPGDKTWCGWTKSCQCDKNYVWDETAQKCHYPAWPKPTCPTGQKCYCGKSEEEYCEYNAENEYCWNDGHNKVFCCAEKDRPQMLKNKCPDNHPQCRPTEVWNGDSKSCKCPNGKLWRDNTCKYPVMPQPTCSGKQKPCCAKNNLDWSHYDESKEECSDNGKYITFCAEPGQEQSYCNTHWN
ncbi:hypothetical protein SUNI508_06902 [Seiridium unicorne]|uniref:Uncharacterized protein n=1 Tax=Seiridium unicorne TaxID=138068 RepID=A0ABR2UZ93_9PEZI